MNEVEQVLDKNSGIYRCLSKWGGVSELYHVSIFKGYRQAKNGECHSVTIEIWDAGPNPADLPSNCRYIVKAKDEDTGATATCNPAPTIEMALDTTHWAELDAT